MKLKPDHTRMSQLVTTELRYYNRPHIFSILTIIAAMLSLIAVVFSLFFYVSSSDGGESLYLKLSLVLLILLIATQVIYRIIRLRQSATYGLVMGISALNYLYCAGATILFARVVWYVQLNESIESGVELFLRNIFAWSFWVPLTLLVAYLVALLIPARTPTPIGGRLYWFNALCPAVILLILIFGLRGVEPADVVQRASFLIAGYLSLVLCFAVRMVFKTFLCCWLNRPVQSEAHSATWRQDALVLAAGDALEHVSTEGEPDSSEAPQPVIEDGSDNAIAQDELQETTEVSDLSAAIDAQPEIKEPSALNNEETQPPLEAEKPAEPKRKKHRKSNDTQSLASETAELLQAPSITVETSDAIEESELKPELSNEDYAGETRASMSDTSEADVSDLAAEQDADFYASAETDTSTEFAAEPPVKDAAGTDAISTDATSDDAAPQTTMASRVGPLGDSVKKLAGNLLEKGRDILQGRTTAPAPSDSEQSFTDQQDQENDNAKITSASQKTDGKGKVDNQKPDSGKPKPTGKSGGKDNTTNPKSDSAKASSAGKKSDTKPAKKPVGAKAAAHKPEPAEPPASKPQPRKKQSRAKRKELSESEQRKLAQQEKDMHENASNGNRKASDRADQEPSDMRD